MNDLTIRDNRGRAALDARSVTAVAVSAVLSVACIQWMPVFFFFFPIPLLTVFFTSEKPVFALSLCFAFALDAAISLMTLAVSAAAYTPSDLLLTVGQSAMLILPLFCLLIPGKLRIRYRIALTGIIAAVAWLFMVFGSSLGAQVTALLRDIADETAKMLYAMVPEGSERTAIQAQFDGESLYALMMKFFSYSFMPFCIAMYATGFVIASGVAAIMRRKPAIRFKATAYFNDWFMSVPLVCGIAGVVAGRMIDTGMIDTVFWNVLIASCLFFVLQGYGILMFFLEYLRPKVGRWANFFIVLALFLAVFYGWPFLLGALLIAGVVELFVPLRRRFYNNDIADPTPGNGNDQNL